MKKDDASGPKHGRVMGNKISEKGYQNDSMGLLIDPNAYYDYQHIGAKVLAIYRTGLPAPKNPHKLIRR
jgi:hypothetical protein